MRQAAFLLVILFLVVVFMLLFSSYINGKTFFTENFHKTFSQTQTNFPPSPISTTLHDTSYKKVGLEFTYKFLLTS